MTSWSAYDVQAAELLACTNICVLATLLDDGMPYTSAAHFAPDDEHERLYISLDARSRTAAAILGDARTAMTIGTDPAVPRTLQLRGLTTPCAGEQLERAHRHFYRRFPHSERFRDHPNTLFVVFDTTWKRFADASTRREYFMRGFAPEQLSWSLPTGATAP